jgi:hypothetical protein
MTPYFLAVVFFLLAGLSLSAIPFAMRDGYRTGPIYTLASVLFGIGIVCVVLG